MGPHSESGPFWYYVDGEKAQQRRVLWNPGLNERIFGELNDGSFSEEGWPAEKEAPGIWVKVTVPAGPHRMAVYFENFDGQAAKNCYRDFPLWLYKQPEDLPDDNLNDRAAFFDALVQQPVLAKARVSQAWGGVYERFVLNGKGTYWLRIHRNHSYVTKLQGLFLDRLGAVSADDTRHTDNDPPAVEANVALPAAARVAWDLRETIEKSWDRTGIEGAVPMEILAYRALEAGGCRGGEGELAMDGGDVDGEGSGGV